MPDEPGPRFELRNVSETDWLILDHRYSSDDARSVVGCVYELEPWEYGVIWMRDIPVSLSYSMPTDALEDVVRFYRGEGVKAAAIPPSVSI